MAAPKYTDRILAQEVRSLTLKKIKAVLESDEDKEFQKALLLKLASTVLPRLNEHTGGVDEEGNLTPVLVKFIDGSSTDNRDTSGVQAPV